MAFNFKKSNNNIIESSPEINITPFVDILLVLIVILMVVIPATFTNIDVSLPSKNNDEISLKEDDFIIEIKKDKTIFVQGKQIDSDKLIPELKINRINKNKKIYIACDKDNLYKDVVNVLDTLVKSGYINTILVTEKK